MSIGGLMAGVDLTSRRGGRFGGSSARTIGDIRLTMPNVAARTSTATTAIANAIVAAAAQPTPFPPHDATMANTATIAVTIINSRIENWGIIILADCGTPAASIARKRELNC